MTKPKGRTAKETAPPRANRVRAVGDMLPEVGGASFRRFGFVQSAVVSRWGEIVGTRYAGVSTPESIRFPAGKRSGGTLSLVVESAHAAVMQHVAPEIVERVNRFFGYPAVARIAMRQGAASAPRRIAADPSPKPVPEELGRSLRAIADPELRACLEGLAGALAASTGLPKIG